MSISQIIYVEDDENDIFLMERALRKGGLNWTLCPIRDGYSAISFFSGTDAKANSNWKLIPDLVLIDLNLPGISGFQVLEWFRAQSRFDQVPAVIFSSSPRQEDIERARQLGADDYIEKPQFFEGFSEVLRRLKDQWLVEVIVETS